MTVTQTVAVRRRRGGAARRGRAGQHGFTLIEMTLVLAMLVAIFSALAVGVRSGHAANAEIERRVALTLMADDLMDRLFRIDFGQASDGAASASQLSALFDDDDDLGTCTLTNLRVFSGAAGYQFQLADFAHPGIFEVLVSTDLNGDGDEFDANENTSEVFRLDVNFLRPDGKTERVMECVRARPVG